LGVNLSVGRMVAMGGSATGFTKALGWNGIGRCVSF
jgi:hypothetical protein